MSQRLSATRRSILTLCALAGALALPVALPTSAAHAADTDLAKVVAERSSAIVSIKFMLRMQQQEMEDETVGAIVSADGLVVTSALPLGMGPQMGDGAPTPGDFKILIGDDTTGVDATMVARDSELGLVWLKISQPKSEGYAFVDFTKAAGAKVGDGIVSVQRLGTFVGRAATTVEGRVGAAVAKPRELMVPTSAFAGAELGLPVFNTDGAPIGIATFIIPDQDEMAGGRRALLRGMVNGGQILPMILPAAAFVEATTQALANPLPPPAPEPAVEAPATPATPATPGNP